jgi:hypothetical protein
MKPDSRRYHRRKGPRHQRGFNFGQQSSTPEIMRPFGYMPNNIARQMWRQQEQPFLRALGIQGGQGPEAGLLNFLGGGAGAGPTGGFLGQMIPGLQGIGADAATTGTQTFQGLQGQVDQFLNQLPGFQQVANQGIGATEQGAGYAGQFAQSAFDPQSQNALYQQAGQRMLDLMRPGEAGRGLQAQGAGQQSEQDALQNLSFQQAQQQQANQLQAIQQMMGAGGQLGQAAGVGAQLGQAGISPMAQLFGQVPGLMNIQSQQYGLPFQGVQDFLGLLGFGQQGAGNLLGMTAPQVATKSSQYNVGIL